MSDDFNREEARRRARERLEARQYGAAGSSASSGRSRRMDGDARGGRPSSRTGRPGAADGSRQGMRQGSNASRVRGYSEGRDYGDAPTRRPRAHEYEEDVRNDAYYNRADRADVERRVRNENYDDIMMADGEFRRAHSRRSARDGQMAVRGERSVSSRRSARGSQQYDQPSNPVLDILGAIVGVIAGFFGTVVELFKGLIDRIAGGSRRSIFGGPSLADGFDFKKIGIVVGAIVVVIVLIFGGRGCMDACSGCLTDLGSGPALQKAMDKYQDVEKVTHEKLVAKISKKKLRQFLTKEDTNAIVKLAKDDVRIAWICVNYDNKKYAEDGAAVQAKLLRLALDPEAVDFVRNFPEMYPQKKQSAGCEAFEEGTVPHLYQWDTRWAFTEYSSTTFALTGCSPTSMAMVYQGLTGKHDKSPYDMGKLAKKKGYMTKYNGTTGGFFTGVAGKLGLNAFNMNISKKAVKDVLDNGGLVITNVGPGDFTQSGHYLVITGIEGNKVTVNDPYSSIRSAKTWDISKVLKQTKALYGFYKA